LVVPDIEAAESQAREAAPILLKANCLDRGKELPEPNYRGEEGVENFPISIELSDVVNARALPQ